MTTKRITLIRLFFVSTLVTTLAGCDQDYETIFPDTPDDRVEASVQEYNNTLMSAPYGWKAALYTASGAGYFYYFDFNEGGSVTMLSDFNAAAAGEPIVSDWTVKGLQRPTLSFTSYSYIHLPADPDGNVNNGIPGSGLLSDFEFAFTEVLPDTVLMTGLRHHSEIALVKATQAESEAYQSKRIQDLLLNTEEYLDQHRGYRLLLPDGSAVPMALSIPYKLISFQYVDGATINLPRTSFMFSIDGITLKESINVKGYEIDRLVWNDDGLYYYVPFSEPSILSGSDQPFILDPSLTLFSLLGQEPVSMALPGSAGTQPLPGQSDKFTQIYNETAVRLVEGQYRLSIEEMRLVFIPNTDRMLVIMSITQPSEGGGVARFTAQYLYSYQLRDGDVLKFRQENMDENAGLIYMDMLGILSHFDNDTFTIEYVGGGFGLIAGLFSVEEPDYYFSGYLAE